MYKTITNPISGKIYSIESKLGKQLINKYVNNQSGGVFVKMSDGMNKNLFSVSGSFDVACGSCVMNYLGLPKKTLENWKSEADTIDPNTGYNKGTPSEVIQELVKRYVTKTAIGRSRIIEAGRPEGILWNNYYLEKYGPGGEFSANDRTQLNNIWAKIPPGHAGIISVPRHVVIAAKSRSGKPVIIETQVLRNSFGISQPGGIYVGIHSVTEYLLRFPWGGLTSVGNNYIALLESGYRLQPQLAKYRKLVSFTDTEIGKRRPSIDGTKEPSIYKDPTMGGLKCSRCLDPFVLSLTPVDNYTCDVCKQFFPAGTKMYGCRVCNKDLCKNCKNNDRENAFVINPLTTKKKKKKSTTTPTTTEKKKRKKSTTTSTTTTTEKKKKKKSTTAATTTTEKKKKSTTASTTI